MGISLEGVRDAVSRSLILTLGHPILQPKTASAVPVRLVRCPRTGQRKSMWYDWRFREVTDVDR
jgi:hypothetical protein